MCIAFWSLSHPDYALILAANRDEFISRPTIAAEWHNFGAERGSNSPEVLSGRDVMAGGTWLGINKRGDIAVLTNITELIGKYESSRGELASNFLTMESLNGSLPDKSSPTPLSQYLTSLLEGQRRYAGFNILLLSPKPTSDNSIQYEGAIATNSRGGGDIVARSLVDRESLCGAISNSDDNAQPPLADKTNEWPKISEGRSRFQEIIGRDGWEQDELIEALCDMMSIQTPTPPTSRYALRTTISVPPIAVEPNAWSKSITPDTVPASTNAAPALIAQQTDYYCTRLTTVILVRKDGQVEFVERDIWSQIEGKSDPVKAEKTSQRRFSFQIYG
ncbi:hypothetical protein FRC09_006146 [Ceratobasidium sp. 395]|nr:hypothetical protein FRC09_006146 [Ceratobasidium sp. 395]